VEEPCQAEEVRHSRSILEEEAVEGGRSSW
jgi:hypothetical protein